MEINRATGPTDIPRPAVWVRSIIVLLFAFQFDIAYQYLGLASHRRVHGHDQLNYVGQRPEPDTD
jgi:hypothetical protein